MIVALYTQLDDGGGGGFPYKFGFWVIYGWHVLRKVEES